MPTDTTTIASDAYVTNDVLSDARIISRAQIESEYTVPRRIQPTMRNTDTTPQAGGQDDGGFRIF